MKYLKRPVTVEAIQWLGDNAEDIRETFAYLPSMKFAISGTNLIIQTVNAKYYVPPKHWVTYEEGRVYVVTPDLFESLYVVASS